MDLIQDIIKQNHGFVTFNQIKESEISYKVVKRLLDAGEIQKEVAGIYRLPNTYIDELFTLQHRYPKGIYSLETALWLHGLSLTVSFEPVMSFPFGTNTKLIKEAGIKPVILRSNYDIGIVDVATHGGQMVKVYDTERTLVEVLRPIYKVDVQITAPAFKAYTNLGKVDYTKLFKYAKMFKVQEKVQSYLEIL
jgi:hypothetical protein